MESIGKALEKALTHYERKDYSAAEKFVDDLLTAHPDFHRGWFLKAVILEETGRSQEAEKCYERAGNVFTMMFRLAMQLQDVDPQRALQYYDRVLQADPKFSMALLHKGLIYEKMGLDAEAKHCFKNLSPWREFLSRIIVPLGFMVLLIIGGIMMIKRGERTLPILILASAVFCLFWLKRDAGTAITMLQKKKKYV